MNQLIQQHELPDRDFEKIRNVVYDHCGINLTHEKRELVRSRLSALLRRHRLTSYSEYLDLALNDRESAEFGRFIDRLSTNLTYFFREKKHFDYLESTLLPQLLAKAPDPARLRLRGWSAACSSGEEPYSLAMTLLEALPKGSQHDVRILASDICTTVLEKARAGCYPSDRMDAVPPALRNRYFETRGERSERLYAARPELRKMIVFKQINLMKEWPVTTQLDFIFCRNVFIYFDKPTHQQLVLRFQQLLKPGGVLFIGHSESLSGISHDLKSGGPAIYIRK